KNWSISEDEFVQVGREEIGDSNLNFKMSGLEIKPSTLAGMIEEVRGLYERFVRFPTDGFEGAEVELNHRTDDGVELVGKVDAVYSAGEDGYRLVDWKTGDLGDVVHQLDFYTLLWALDRQSLPEVVEAISVSTGERHLASPTEERLVETINDVAGMVNELRAAWSR